MARDVWVGVDVAKAKVDVAVLGDVEMNGVFPQDVQGHAALVAKLRKFRPRLVLLEASGGYEREVVHALRKAGLPVSMTLPVRARNFAKSMGKYAKNDAIDAHVLAKMARALEDELRLWQPRTSAESSLRKLVKRRDQVMEMLQMERKRR